MTEKLTTDDLRVLLKVSGLDASEDDLNQMLPQVHSLFDGFEDIEVLEPTRVEPAFVFMPVED